MRSISHTNIKRSTIYTLQADDKNRLWIGSHNGISCIGDGHERYFYGENTMNGEASDKDPSGRIWIACESRIYYTEGDSIQLFMEFPNTIIGNLCYTRNNLIVISCNTGIKIINPATKKVVNYDHTNGYSSGEPSWNTMTEDYDGNIWMGTQGSNVLKFNPSQLTNRSGNLTLYLMSAQQSANNIDRYDMEAGTSLQHHQQNVHFSFTGLCFSNPENVRYHYRLAGFQKEWSEPSPMREVTFNNLPPDIIFTTGYTYPEYLLKAFELAAIDYLVKPVSMENLEKAVARYRERAGVTTGLQNLLDALKEEKLLKFKSYNGLFLLRPDDIVYVEADRDYACMFFANGAKEEVFERLGEIEKKLPAETFLRTGKSIIINRKYVRKITDTALQLATSAASYQVEISKDAIRLLKSQV